MSVNLHIKRTNANLCIKSILSSLYIIWNLKLAQITSGVGLPYATTQAIDVLPYATTQAIDALPYCLFIMLIVRCPVQKPF